MKKYLLMASLLLAAPVWGKTLTPAEALQRVQTTAPAKAAAWNATEPVLLSTGYMDNDQPAYYVFKASEKANGYMVIAADDVATPLLGYSDSGSFNPDQMPDNLRYWLDSYADQISWASQREATGRTFTNKVKASTNAQNWDAIAPMCSTKWNQSAPYSNMTPVITYSGEEYQSVTGCVATAMAQVMKYYNYPKTGTGSTSYTWTKYADYSSSSSGTSNITLSMDFSTVTFDWDNMLDVYSSGSYTDTEADAVATLMKACGYSVGMDYGTSSAASSQSVPVALRNYFGYDAGTTIYFRDYYGIDTWMEMIYNNLKNVGPVYYSGQNYYGGHAFVVDGYDGAGYFHLNWGWGGVSDGYFLITALDPEAQGTGGSLAGYNYGQDAVLGACPAGSSAATGVGVPLILMTDTELTPSISGSKIVLKGSFSNWGSADATNAYFGLEFANYADDATVENAQYGKTTLVINSKLNKLQATIPSTLTAGDYKVYPSVSLSQNADGTQNWTRIPSQLGYPNYVILTVGEDGSYSVAAVDPATIYFDNVELTTAVYYGKTFHVNSTAVNDNSVETITEIYPSLLIADDEDGYSLIAYCEPQVINLRPGESMELSNDIYVIAAGSDYTAGQECYFAFCDLNEGYVLSELIPVTLQTTSESTSFDRPCEFSIANADNVTLDDFRISYSATLAQGYYADNLVFYVFNAAGTSSVGYAMLPVCYLEAGSTVSSTDLKISPSNLSVGTTYNAALYYFNDSGYLTQLSYPEEFTVGAASGVNDVTADSNDASVSAALNGDILTVTATSDIQSVNVYSVSGALVAGSDNSSVALNNLATGVYIVKVVTADGVATLKITK